MPGDRLERGRRRSPHQCRNFIPGRGLSGQPEGTISMSHIKIAALAVAWSLVSTGAVFALMFMTG